MTRRANVTAIASDSLSEVLTEIAAPDVPVGEILRISDQLTKAGVKAVHVRRLISAGVTVKLGERERLPQPPTWYPAVQRWPVACRVCEVEVLRGELASLGKLPDGSWTVECASCRDVSHAGERAESARRWALDKDDDPDGLLQAILEHTPPDLREQVEDDLTLRLEAGRG